MKDGLEESHPLAQLQLLNCFEILQALLLHWDTYLPYLTDEVEDISDWALDYLAFADVFDGNYLAVTLSDGQVFLLDHDLGFFPFADLQESNAGGYKVVAESVRALFAKLVESEGQLLEQLKT